MRHYPLLFFLPLLCDFLSVFPHRYEPGASLSSFDVFSPIYFTAKHHAIPQRYFNLFPAGARRLRSEEGT